MNLEPLVLCVKASDALHSHGLADAWLRTRQLRDALGYDELPSGVEANVGVSVSFSLDESDARSDLDVRVSLGAGGELLYRGLPVDTVSKKHK